MHVCASELLRRYVLPGRSLHEWRPADEDRPGAADDDRFVAHRWDVCASCGARAHHSGDLRDSLRRHLRLVEEDPAKVLAVREDLVLQWQKSPTGVDEIQAGKPALRCDLLRPQVLL